mgnify:CR=1 FL=1
MVGVEVEDYCLALLGDTLGKAKGFCSRSKLGDPLTEEVNICPVGKVGVSFDCNHGFSFFVVCKVKRNFVFSMSLLWRLSN